MVFKYYAIKVLKKRVNELVISMQKIEQKGSALLEFCLIHQMFFKRHGQSTFISYLCSFLMTIRLLSFTKVLPQSFKAWTIEPTAPVYKQKGKFFLVPGESALHLTL